MKIFYDSSVDALDIIFKSGKSARTKEIEPDVLLDVATDGTPLSVEVLGASKRYDRKLLSKIALDLPLLPQVKVKSV